MNRTTDYREFCQAWLNSWSGNQPDKLLDFYTEDVFYSDPANPSGLKGKDGLKKYFEKLLAKNPDWKWNAEEIMPTEKGFTLKWKAVVPVTDKEITIYGLDIVELAGDKICRNEVYFDRTLWLQLLNRV